MVKSRVRAEVRRDGAAELHGITVRAGGLAGRERRGSLYTNLCTSVYRVTRTDVASLPISSCKSHRINFHPTVCGPRPEGTVTVVRTVKPYCARAGPCDSTARVSRDVGSVSLGLNSYGRGRTTIILSSNIGYMYTISASSRRGAAAPVSRVSSPRVCGHARRPSHACGPPARLASAC